MSDRPIFESRREGLLISTSPTLLDLDAISGFLARSYWAEARPREVIERSLSSSLCFGLYICPAEPAQFTTRFARDTEPQRDAEEEGATTAAPRPSVNASGPTPERLGVPIAVAFRQIGFARVVTDYATFAWLCDVFIEEDHRSEGLGKWLIETVVAHPDLQGLRRWLLATRDAHGLYRQFGFTPLASPDRWMERLRP